jgi:hypothetical protein
MLGRRTLMATAAALAAPRIGRAANSHVLRYVPRYGLVQLDPVATTDSMTRLAGLMVFESLYSVDEMLKPRPQMIAGHRVEDGGKHWTMRLREGLRFHDGEPVLARACVASINRWLARDLLARSLTPRLDAVEAPDDRTVVFRLKRPFPRLDFALGKAQPNILPIMPARLATTNRPGRCRRWSAAGRSVSWRTSSALVVQLPSPRLMRTFRGTSSRPVLPAGGGFGWRGWSGLPSPTRAQPPRHCRPAKWTGSRRPWPTLCSSCGRAGFLRRRDRSLGVHDHASAEPCLRSHREPRRKAGHHVRPGPAPERGGWSMFPHNPSGVDHLDPLVALGLRNGAAAWAGWPDNPHMEELRDTWIDSDDAGEQRRIAAAIQAAAPEDVTYVPLGQYVQPTAWRSRLRGVLKANAPVFWNIEKV